MESRERDVAFARTIAMDSLRDLKRCERDYGPSHPVTKVARDCFYSDTEYHASLVRAIARKREADSDR